MLDEGVDMGAKGQKVLRVVQVVVVLKRKIILLNHIYLMIEIPETNQIIHLISIPIILAPSLPFSAIKIIPFDHTMYNTYLPYCINISP